MKKLHLLMSVIFLTVFFILLLEDDVFAQSMESNLLIENNNMGISQEIEKPDQRTDDFSIDGYFSDAGAVLASPIHWDGKDWMKASLVLGAAVVLYNNDRSIQDYFQEHRNPTTDGISGAVKYFGDYRVVVPALALFYLHGCSVHDEKAETAALLSLESLTVAGGFTGALKLAGHRHRPYTGDSNNVWDGPSFSLNDPDLSFPSFHSSTAFAVAAVLSSVYGDDHKWLPYTAYSLATLTALSRVNDNEHWSSDVFAGAVIGYYTAKVIISRHQQNGVDQTTFVPVVGEGNYGLVWSYRF